MRLVYLAGGIFKVEDPATWRKEVTKKLPSCWQAVNPLDLEVNLFNPQDVVMTDLSAIWRCQAVIAKVDAPSWGTAMEIFFAYQKKIPVIGWNSNLLDAHGASPWLTLCCRWTTDNLDDAVNLLSMT